VSQGLPYHEAVFDFVNSRFIAGGITDWFALIRDIYRVVVASGNGWIQITELRPWLYCDDNSLPPNAPSVAWTHLLFGQTELGRRLGTSRFDEIATSLKGWVQAAGFTDVTEYIDKAPVGAWHTGTVLRPEETEHRSSTLSDWEVHGVRLGRIPRSVEA